MTDKLLKEYGLEKGQTVLAMTGHGGYYPYLSAVTIKDVHENWDGEHVVFVEEWEGYITFNDIYSKHKLLSLLGESE